MAHFVFQLRRPAGDLFGVPAARAPDRIDAGATRTARFVIRLGVRADGAFRRLPGRPHETEDGHSLRPGNLERDLRGHGPVAKLRAIAFVPGRRGAWRDDVL